MTLRPTCYLSLSLSSASTLFVTLVLVRTLLYSRAHALKAPERNEWSESSSVVQKPSTATKDNTSETTKQSTINTASTYCISKQTSPLIVCVMVESSPFTYVAGYANSFQVLIRYFLQCGDEVQVI